MRHAQQLDWRKTAKARKEKDHVIRRGTGGERTAILKPKNIPTLVASVDPSNRRATPIRPLGAASSATACNRAAGGTLLDMTELTKVVEHTDKHIRVQAGLRVADLIEILAARGQEVPGCMDLADRTIGGAVASASFGPSCAGDGAIFARNVTAMRVVTPEGRLIEVDESRPELLRVFRLSYGLLGVIADVTLRVRPAQSFVRKHRKMPTEAFANAMSDIAESPEGLKFFLMPFRGQVYTETRRFGDGQTKAKRLSWKFKDWGETTVLPEHLWRSVEPRSDHRRTVLADRPGTGCRPESFQQSTGYADGTVQDEALGATSSRLPRPTLKYSTWCFPASRFWPGRTGLSGVRARLLSGENRFRCDMPATGFRLAADRSALLSPSFDEAMIALRVVSTPHRQWEDFRA